MWQRCPPLLLFYSQHGRSDRGVVETWKPFCETQFLWQVEDEEKLKVEQQHRKVLPEECTGNGVARGVQGTPGHGRVLLARAANLVSTASFKVGLNRALPDHGNGCICITPLPRRLSSFDNKWEVFFCGSWPATHVCGDPRRLAISSLPFSCGSKNIIWSFRPSKPPYLPDII